MKGLGKEYICSGIYYLKNKFNGKIYIGSSKNIRSRLYNHKNKLKHNKHANPYLQNTVGKYGLDCFEVGILEKCKEDELEVREQFYLDTERPEYNLTLDAIRNTLSKESRLKQSKTRKKRIKTGEIKLVGKKHIYLYNIDGTFHSEYESIGDACRDLNIKCRGCITKALFYSTTNYSHNFLWSLAKVEKMKEYTKIIYK